VARTGLETVQLAPDRAHSVKERRPTGGLDRCMYLTPGLETKGQSGGGADMPFFRGGSTPFGRFAGPIQRVAIQPHRARILLNHDGMTQLIQNK